MPIRTWYEVKGMSAVARLTVICALAAVAVYAAGNAAGKSAGEAAAKQAAEAVLKSDAVSCDRNQVQRTYDRVDELQVRRLTTTVQRMKDSDGQPRQAPLIANAYFQIVNCGATYQPANVSGGGDPVYLTQPDERCFLHLIVTHYFLRRQPTTDPAVLRSIC